MSRHIKSAISVARTEYIRWITNPRIIIVGVLLIFMHTLSVEPLLRRAVKLGVPLNLLEPFIAIGNSGMLVMLMPCVFLILISDYPKMTGNSLFFMHRTGRLHWFLGQILFLIFAIVTYLSLIIGGSILMSKGVFSGTWSDVITKYNAMFPAEAASFASGLIPSNLYNQLSLVTALLQTILLMSAYLYVLSMIIYLFKLLHLHAAGLFGAITVVAAGVVTCSLQAEAMWLFPMANTIVWLHFDEILSAPDKPVWYSYLYFIILILILTIANSIAIKKFQFYNVEHVE